MIRRLQSAAWCASSGYEEKVSKLWHVANILSLGGEKYASENNSKEFLKDLNGLRMCEDALLTQRSLEAVGKSLKDYSFWELRIER